MSSLARRIILVFLGATAVISQCLVWAGNELGINTELVAPAQYGPALAALLTWVFFRARLGEMMPGRVARWAVRMYLMVAVSACVLFGGVFWIEYSLIGGRDLFGARTIGGMPFWSITVAWLIGAAAEETGWRGVLQPTLETALPRWAAGIVVGLAWSVWHLPMITQGAATALLFTSTTTVLAMFLAYLGNGSPVQRVVTTSVVHWLVNLAILVVSGVTTDRTELAEELLAISITAGVFAPVAAALATRHARHTHLGN